MPKILWQSFGVDDEGKEREDFLIRIVETPLGLMLETRRYDAMGEPSWQPIDMKQHWVLRAFVKSVVKNGGA
jgi:hypothetical protein